MHFHAVDNTYDLAFPPTATAFDAATATEVTAHERNAQRGSGRAILRSTTALFGSFVVIFSVLYVGITWPLAPQQISYYLSRLSAPAEQSASAAALDTTADSDGDGYTNSEEVAAGYSPTDAAPVGVDTDQDGLFDAVEVRFYGTNPLEADSDGDGYGDLVEVSNGYSPLRRSDYQRWVAERTQARISIEKIGLDAPVVWNQDLDKIYDDLKLGVVHYRSTANPGDPGNVVIAGHSSQYVWNQNEFGTVFALLDKLKAGDEITVDYVGTRYTYVVEGVATTTPNDTRLFGPTGDPTLTLVSCWPAGSNDKRIFVVSKLVSSRPIDQ